MSESPSIPLYHVTSNPLPMSAEMFAAMGEILVLWSRIEASIDQDITTMMQWPIVRGLIKERPFGFRRKLDLWRRCVSTLYPKIQVYQAQATEFKRAALIISKVRNHLIHGAWSLQQTDRGGFSVTSIRHQMVGANVDKVEVTPEFLEALLSDMRKLDSAIISFIVTKSLHAHFGLLSLDKGE